MKEISIHVVESTPLGAGKPMNTIMKFSNDYVNNSFVCPVCQNDVPITYSEDSRGKHANSMLKCMECSSVWNILLY